MRAPELGVPRCTTRGVGAPPRTTTLEEPVPDAQTSTIRTTGREHITALVARSRKKLSAHDRSTVLHQLIAQYAALPADAAPLAYEVRQAFLRTLEHVPAILTDEAVTRFLADHIEPEDFAELQWQSPSAVVAYCELLYQFRFASDAMAQHVQALERNLLRYALQQYERQGAYEKMFQLLKLAPTAPALSDAELQRLRNRAYLYEHRRVRRRRRWLYAYLLLQVVLIVGVFPVVFMAAESGVLQQQVEAVSGIGCHQSRTACSRTGRGCTGRSSPRPRSAMAISPH